MAGIDFSELVSGATVTKYDGNMYDGVEMVMAVTGKIRKLALQDIGRLDEETFESFKLKLLKLPGRGTAKTYTVHISNLVEFIMVLPGKAATSYRQKFADIVTRYLAGDASLHSEIQANAASSSPVCEMAREALNSSEAADDSVSGEKRSAAALNDTVSCAAREAGILVKRLKEVTDAATGVKPTMASMKLDVEATAAAMENIVKFKKDCFDLDVRGRAKEMVDAVSRVAMDTSTRAKEREDIIAKARADAEAIAIVAEAKRKARMPAAPAPSAQYPDTATFLPEDHTTVEKVYNENKGLQVDKRDKANYLNEARLEVLRLYRVEFNGANPKRVMCEFTKHLVEMYPKNWAGLKTVLVNRIRHKKGGFGQMSISGCFAPESHIHVHLGRERD
jgi:hypothetical protein